MKFFVYTLAGSLVTLLGLIGLVWALQERAHLSQPFYLPELARAAWQHRLPVSTQIPLFWMVVAGFLVKVPVFPWHTWLPLAHVEAPTAGSVLLAGVLLKLGTYGMLRLCLPLLPDATRLSGVPWLGALAVVGIIYGSLCALAQQDIKRLVAYSSVAHLGFCVLGLMALNPVGLTGSVLQMINHGLSTGGLFCLVGTLYERYHTRHLADLGGLASRFPRLGVLMTWIALASIGLPGMNGFVGEMLSLAGMFQATHTQGMLYAALGATGVILGAWYLLNVLRIAFFGTIREPATDHPISDLNLREMLALFPLAALCLLLGIFPQPLINLIEPDLLPLCEVLRRGMFAGS
ncbi:MAG: hypothetical protein KatS3mg114_0061 [Planctomycetaceae bacterium]|nr:MAG: hypothetical protein KatS3mg114_0061 [Planctomycetaceae bacterium]